MDTNLLPGETVRQQLHRLLDEAFEGEIEDVGLIVHDEMDYFCEWDEETHQNKPDTVGSSPYHALEIKINFRTKGERDLASK
jgi:hypothetical protein